MDDEGLNLEITDDYSAIAEFDAKWDYKKLHSGKLYNEVRIQVWRGNETVAYLKCFVFYDSEIEAAGYDLVTVADNDLCDDAVEAMTILSERERQDEDELFDFLYMPKSTVYLHHVAVRDDFRGRGIGSWLIRNLPDILVENRNVYLGVIIVKLYPQSINWGTYSPSFVSDLGDPEEHADMFIKMKRLLESNGYNRHGDSLFFIRDCAGGS